MAAIDEREIDRLDREILRLERELVQANADLAAERKVSKMREADARTFKACLDSACHDIAALKVRAESAECRAEEVERVLRLGLRYFGADAETVMLTIAEDGSTLADFQEQARAFLDAAKKEG